MQRKIRWGLLGAGNILHRWMKGVRQVEDMEIAAVSSRTKERAQLMAETFQIPEALTYEELLAREDIDIVYIPVPHPAHKDLAIRAMNAGKAVLVEKPAGINARELDEMVACARKNGVFFMDTLFSSDRAAAPVFFGGWDRRGTCDQHQLFLPDGRSVFTAF